MNRNKVRETVIIKAARYFRFVNERNILRKFQFKTSCLRPLVNEIAKSQDSSTIVLKYLENDLLTAFNARKLTGKKLKYVSKRIPETLKVLHEKAYVHTDENYNENKYSHCSSISNRNDVLRCQDKQCLNELHVTSPKQR